MPFLPLHRWQGHMKVALHGTVVHTIIIILVVADALIVSFVLLLEVGALGKCVSVCFACQVQCHY